MKYITPPIGPKVRKPEELATIQDTMDETFPCVPEDMFINIHPRIADLYERECRLALGAEKRRPVQVFGFTVPLPMQRWRHTNGNLYQVLSVSNLRSQRPEYPVTVTYQGTNGHVWSKTLVNFLRKMRLEK